LQAVNCRFQDDACMKYSVALAGLVATAAATLAGAAVFVFSGAYNVAATSQHLQPIHTLLETTMRQSVRLRASSVTEPAPGDTQRAQRGAVCYQSLCVQCHGAPGVAQNDIGKSMQPVPGPLVDALQRWQPRELYWITRHGIKMSGMPAWEFRLDDGQIWDVVAFIERLPTLSPQAYAAATTASASSQQVGPGTCVQGDLKAVQATGVPLDGATAGRLTGRTAESGASPERGRIALSQYACSACHTIPGVTSSYPNVGPPLAGMAGRRLIAGRLANTPDNMVAWLRKPHTIKLDTAMPDMGVTDAHARDMAAYLSTLD
jgi:mono/diheme cytochrome c family protein